MFGIFFDIEDVQMEDRLKQERYMRRAIELAKKGTGWVSPNPLVGALITRDDQIISEGWHEKYGDLHAERNALKKCQDGNVPTEGATMYVTLEPCCHHGKQPPCTDAIIQAGIRKVYVGSNDPNPLVAGKGIEILRDHGIEVETEFLREECDSINPIFFHYIKTKEPYVVMKYAMTMDGKIATYTGASQWITGPDARHRVHEDRHRYRGIMAGIDTVLVDDPMLNCRIDNGRDPIRIICDTNLRTPLDSQLVQTAKDIRTIIATSIIDESKHRCYKEMGCEIMILSEVGGHIDLVELMQRLGAQGVDSILLEGGGTLNWSMLKAGLVHKVQTYIAPKLFGGDTAKAPIGGQGVENPDQAFGLCNSKITRVGDDILIESEVRPDVYRNR